MRVNANAQEFVCDIDQTIQDDIRNAGGNWIDQSVVTDHNWVSSRQPSDIPAFNSAMIGLFAQLKERAHRA
jgi:protease I